MIEAQTTQIENRVYTIEAFEAFIDLPENRDRHFELIYGEIVEKMPTEEHGVLATNIASPIWNFVKPEKLGRVAVEPRHRAPDDPHNDRLPDVAYTAAERLLPLTRKGSVPQMPDLCVEIQSPDDKPNQMRQKALFYLRNGARLVWLVYAKTRSVEVCTLNAEGVLQIAVLDENAALDGGEVLPGFALAIKEIFEVV